MMELNYDDVCDFLTFHRYPTGFSKNQKRVLRRKCYERFQVKRGLLYYSRVSRGQAENGKQKARHVAVKEDTPTTDSSDYTTACDEDTVTAVGSNADSADSADSESTDYTTADEDFANSSSSGMETGNILLADEHSAIISTRTANISTTPSLQIPSSQPSTSVPYQPWVSLSQPQCLPSHQLPPSSIQLPPQLTSKQHFISADTPGDSPERRALCQLSDDLVLAIRASDITAIKWKLFSKGLIEEETHEKCSLEFTQLRKSSWIVDDLIKKVSADPHLLETLLSVLSESESPILISVGEKIKQTYKCESFKEHLKRSVPCHSHIFHSRMLYQSTAPHQLQSPVYRYANYLRDFYTQSEFPEYSNPACYKWIPSPGKKFQFINLAVISKEQLPKKEADTIKNETIHGRIDLVLKKKAPIAIENILQVEQGQQLTCIWIEGAPGIGKSTLAWTVCARWGRGELFQQYSIVLLVTLRDVRTQRAKYMEDLFYHNDSEIRKKVVQEINTTKGKGILIILEGLDELPEHYLSECSIFTALLSGETWPKATRLVTSRPSATDKLWQIWWQKKSRRVEILGFTEENINEYSKSVLTNDQLSGFKIYLSIHPHMKSMMYVPLHCAITTVVYLECQQSHRPPPKTLTGLYTCLAEIILKQYLKDHPNQEYKASASKFSKFSDLPSPVYECFKKLCNLAFDGVCKQQLVFDNPSQLPDNPYQFEHLGFMNAIPELRFQQSVEEYSYNFLHLSVQEYLAAYHISLMSHHEQEQLLRTFKYGDHHFNMTRFLAGITQLKQLDKNLVKKLIGIRHFKYDNDMYSPLYGYRDDEINMSKYTLEFLYECQDVSILDCDCYYKADIQSTDSAHNLTALDYCIANSSLTWHVSFTERDDNGSEVLWQSLKNCTHPTYNIEYIRFKACDPDFILHILQCLPKYALLRIKELSVNHQQLLPSLSEQIIRMKTLTTLTVNNALDASAIHLIPALSRVSSLRNVWIYDKIGNFRMLCCAENHYFINGTLPFIDQFLPNLPQQTITQIGSLKIQHLQRIDIPLPLQPRLLKLISRMETLNTLKLVNIIDNSLTQLLPILCEVHTLRTLAVHKLNLEGINLLCKWLNVPSCQLELLTLYEEIGAEAATKTVTVIDSSSRTIECHYCTKRFIDYILKQLSQKYLVHISVNNLKKNVNDYVYVYADKDEEEWRCEKEQEYDEEWGCEEEQEYEEEWGCEEEQEYEEEWDEYEDEDEYGYGDKIGHGVGDNEHKSDENEAQSVHKSKSKAGNENSKENEDNYQELPCLPELIPAMERLDTLILIHVSVTSLREFMPVLSTIPTLKNLQVNNHFVMQSDTIKSVSCTFLVQLLVALPQETIANIESLEITYGDECRYLSYEDIDQLPDIIPKMRLNTLILTNTLDASLNKIIPALYRVPTLRNLTLHELDSQGITLLCQWLLTCQLEKLVLIETLEIHKRTITFCSGLIECKYTETEFTDHILSQLPQQSIRNVKSLTIDNEKYEPVDEWDAYGNNDHLCLSPPLLIPSSLFELIPRMEELTTLTLKNVLHSSLTELIPVLSRVPTLRNLTLHKMSSEGITILCQLLPTYKLEMLKIYEQLSDVIDLNGENEPTHKLIEISFCNNYIEVFVCLQCTMDFIYQILSQIPQQYLACIKMLTIDNSICTYKQLSILPGMREHIKKMEKLNALTLKNILADSVAELIPLLYNVPTLRYLTLNEVNSKGLALLYQWLHKGQLEVLNIIHDYLGDVTLKFCNEHVIDIECQHCKAEFIDQVLIQTLSQSISDVKTLIVNNNWYRHMGVDDNDHNIQPLPIPLSLLELIPRMEKLATLTMENVTDTSLTELVQALPRVPALKNLTLHKLNTVSIAFLCQWIPTCHLETLKIQEEDSHVITITFYNKSIDTIECQNCTTEFIHQILSQISQQSFTHIKTLSICNEEEYYYNFKVTPPSLPACLPELILVMRSINTLILKNVLDTSLIALISALYKVPTLRNLTLPKLNSEGIALLYQWLPTCHLETLNIHEEDTHVMTITCYYKSVEAIECHYCTTKFIHHTLTQLSQLSFTQVKVLKIRYEEQKYGITPQALPVCLPELVLIMQKLNTLTLENTLDTSLIKLIPFLHRVPTLRNLTLSKLSSEGIALVCQWLCTPICQLESLTLPHLSPNHIKTLSRVVATMLSLKALSIYRSKFILESLQDLASMLKQNQALSELDITSCNIDSIGVSYLSETLYHNAALKKLYMSKNSVGERGAQAVAEMLKHNTTLEELDLSNAHIGSSGSVTIVKALNNNTTLKRLCMSKNSIGERGAVAVAAMLKHNTTLEELDLCDAHISSDGSIAIAEALNQNTSLRKVDGIQFIGEGRGRVRNS